MVDWYCKLLGARINHGTDKITFLTNDAEHHRIALVAMEPYAAKAQGVTVGFYHAAFAYADLRQLVGAEHAMREARREWPWVRVP
jgi:catechol-2,3-dioxygenase